MAIKTNATWAYSAANRPIELHQCVNETDRPLLMIGGVHGDEPEGVTLANHLLAWLQKKQDYKVPWILIPCINPDGIHSNERTNSNGVDLNRNFPCRNWESSYSKPRYFPGKQANSEPEVQALVRLIEEVQPHTIIHFHSWKPCIVVTGKPGLAIGQIFSDVSGYPLQETIGYETPGSLGDYGWQEHKIPVICIEESDEINHETIWERFVNAFEKII